MTFKRRRLKILFICISELTKYYLFYPLAILLYGRKNLWLICERSNEARDNGYWMFKYVREEHPEIKCFYLIDFNSPDFKKVQVLGNTVKYGSLKHRLMFIAAKYRLSTHLLNYSPNDVVYQLVFKCGFLKKILFMPGKNIFLQHGITINNHPMLYASNAKIDLFICGAEPEYDFIRKTFGYSDDNAKYTGFARFDTLNSTNVKKEILIMPTWRNYVSNLNTCDFKTTEYYNKWQSLLNNVFFVSEIQKLGVNIIFFPHSKVQKFIHEFSSISKNIVIANKDSYDVQHSLKNASLLITDYSSVFFDFAYMRKPCIYYQFDKNDFEKKHYKPGYFKYDLMGFGEIVCDEQELITLIVDYARNDFPVKQMYLNRIDSFFPKYDANNCSRIFDSVVNLK